MSVREKKKKKNKNAILQAAISLFRKNGYENTSIEQIARAAGVGKGTFYSYFQNKKDIVKGFYDDELELVHNELLGRANRDTPILEQMVTIYMAEFRQVTRNPEFGRLFMRESVFPDKQNPAGNAGLENNFFSMLFPILERAQQRGELRRDIEILHITEHFHSLFVMVVSSWYTGRLPIDGVEQAMTSLFTQLLEGLCPPPFTLTKLEKNNG
ncbi:TetR/AcrR family transcriptional regulator [Desulforhopalus singaporensis]|uniref:Transcriptional regulator, TetR family n=1 Tax=Desulforhopalus singaporensis TaxID=91360 RepID=A0A1H0NEW7_9BACT|nr:TetR/AcrR family transcriptional regulator [Desulforhopalus singaporensis]SDO91292.1 transcriptional regulator, TetR family [Desulforhopalus singaporensis]